MTSGSGFPVPAPPSPLRILVVDDEPMLRSVIEEFLAILGYTQHFMAGNGRQALDVLRNHPIDCILSDIRMPELELEEMLGIVRKEWPDLVVIATSGYSDMESAANIIGKGAADFLGKPLNLDALEAALKWVSWRRDVLARIAADGPSVDWLTEALDSAPVFTDKMRHARRVGRLLEELETGLSPENKEILAQAALLHELGMCYQIHSLCAQPRALADNEQALVRASSSIAGHMVSAALGRRDLETVITRHMHWQAITDRQIGDEPLLGAAVWLGLANSVIGCTSERPDRPAIKLGRVRESLERRLRQDPTGPLRSLLDQWATVERVVGQDVSPN